MAGLYCGLVYMRFEVNLGVPPWLWQLAVLSGLHGV
jgi:hypothetical protein